MLVYKQGVITLNARGVAKKDRQEWVEKNWKLYFPQMKEEGARKATEALYDGCVKMVQEANQQPAAETPATEQGPAPTPDTPADPGKPKGSKKATEQGPASGEAEPK